MCLFNDQMLLTLIYLAPETFSFTSHIRIVLDNVYKGGRDNVTVKEQVCFCIFLADVFICLFAFYVSAFYSLIHREMKYGLNNGCINQGGNYV